MDEDFAESLRNPIASRGTLVDIRVSGKNLVGKYGQDTPNALAVVFLRTQEGSASWQEVSRSEVKSDNGNPHFGRAFAAEYQFNVFQEVRVCIFDCIEPDTSLEAQHLIGVADTSLAAILSARGSAIELELRKDMKATACWVTVSGDEVRDAKKEVIFEIALKGLMTPQERSEQEDHLAKLGAQLNVPSSAPAVQRRPVAAVMSRFRKDEKKMPSIRPAHIENMTYKEQKHKESVVQKMKQVHAAPPPFMPYVIISTCPETAVAQREFRDWNHPDIPWEECYQSEDVMQYNDVEAGITLEQIRLPYTLLNGGGMAEEVRYMKFSVMRARPGGNTIEVGSTVTTLRALDENFKIGHESPFNMNPSGLFIIKMFEIVEMPSFLDTIKQSNLDMGLVVGIDFTQSNGPPESISSLHYQSPEGMAQSPNHYEAAIQSVANLLSAYSSDPRIAAYGFGAMIPPSWDISHCFSLTGDPQMPLCDNVNALIGHYRNVLPRIKLWGPTMFSELLFNFKTIVSRRATAAGSALAYTCALIVTDGVCSDMEKTREQLIDLSRYPCSIIIIGVGGEDFTRMRTLDDSAEGRGVLKRGRDVAERHFVQFVDYSSFTDSEKGQVDFSRLSSTVLGHIPDHVIEFIEYDKKSRQSR